jgi:predicted N-acyltransferase
MTSRHFLPNHQLSQRVQPDAAPALAKKVEVRDSIGAFEASEWNAVLSGDEPQLRHDFLLAAQSSGAIKNPRFLAVSREGRLAGVAVAYQSDIDVLTLAAPSLQAKIQRVRRGPFKRLGFLRAHVCGPVITNCRPNVALAPWLLDEERQEVARELTRAVEDLPGGALRVFFEMPDESVQDFGAALEECGFVRAHSLPGTRLDIPRDWHSFEDYVGAMRKMYRRAVRDDQERGQELDIQIESNFSHLADEVFALYSNVVARAQSNFEELTPAFFREFGACEQARLVTARERSTGKLVGIELLLVGKDGVQDLYTGVDYDYNERYNVYFNLMYPAIALACERGFARVTTGQTSYTFKSRIGVEAFDLSIYLKHRNPLVNALLRVLHPVICPKIETTSRRVFKSQAQHIDTPPSTATSRP